MLRWTWAGQLAIVVLQKLFLGGFSGHFLTAWRTDGTLVPQQLRNPLHGDSISSFPTTIFLHSLCDMRHETTLLSALTNVKVIQVCLKKAYFQQKDLRGSRGANSLPKASEPAQRGRKLSQHPSCRTREAQNGQAGKEEENLCQTENRRGGFICTNGPVCTTAELVRLCLAHGKCAYGCTSDPKGEGITVIRECWGWKPRAAWGTSVPF